MAETICVEVCGASERRVQALHRDLAALGFTVRDGGHRSADEDPARSVARVRLVDARDAHDPAAAIAQAGVGGADLPLVVLLPDDAPDTLAAAFAAGATEILADRDAAPEQLRRVLRSASIRHASARDLAESDRGAERDFLATVIHDLRSPMTGILGMTSLLLETELDGRQAEYLDVVRSCTDTVLGLVNDFLDFAKIEAGRVELSPIEFDVRTAVEESLRMVSGQARDKGLGLVLLTRPGVPDRVIADPGRTRQILNNLLSNAIKFTVTGDVTVEIDVPRASEDEVLLRIRVTDTGPGIPESKVHRLFRAYTQADAGVAGRHGGTGLGLFICARLAELMGGEIGVRSRPGEGTDFWFTVSARPARSRHDCLHADGTARSAPRVLVADFGAAPRSGLVKELVAEGIDATPAGGRAGIMETLMSAAESGSPMDAALLVGDPASAIAAARAIRRRPALRDLRLIQLVDTGRRGDAARARAAGLDAYLAAPITADEIAECLFHLTWSARGEDEGELVTRHTLVEARRVRLPRILVADADLVEHKRTARLLQELGYRSDWVDSARDAIAALTRSTYAAALVSLELADRTGTEVARVLRSAVANERRPVPLIGMLAAPTEESRRAFMNAGLDDAVPRPLASDVLQERLSRLLIPGGSAESAGGDRHDRAIA